MNLLVTGGLGSIGFEVVQRAAQQDGVNIITVGRSPSSFQLPSSTVHVMGSVRDETFMSRVIADSQITHIIHAAGSRTSECANDPLLGFENNVLATDSLLRVSRASDSVRKVVFLSSAAVYGKTEQPIDESWTVAPASNYAVTKAAAEICVEGHGVDADFETIIVRPGFVLGFETVNTLGHYIRSVVKQELIELQFADRFFLHWLPEMAKSIFDLLTVSVGPAPRTFHLPGVACRLDELASILKQVASEFQLSPEFSVTPYNSLSVPADLNFEALEKVIGKSNPSELEDICRSLIQQEYERSHCVT